MLVFLWQGNIKQLCDFLLWMDQITEKMVINRFRSPFFNLVSPNTKKKILVINHVQVAVLLIIRNGPRQSLMTLLAF